MNKLFFSILLLLAGIQLNAQCPTGKCGAACNVDLEQIIDRPDCGQNNGTFTMVATGQGPFSYQWSTGATGPTISNVGAGFYTVTITDGNGCSFEVLTGGGNGGETSYSMAVNTFSNLSCNPDGTITVAVYPSGGVPPYSYNWLNSSSTSNSATLQNGESRAVIITDSNGCAFGHVNRDSCQ